MQDTDHQPSDEIKTGDLTQVVERPDDELLITSLYLGKILLRDDLLVYENASTQSFFVPLQDVLEALEFPVTFNVEKQTATGWYITEKNVFDLNLKTKKVTSGDKVSDITSAEVEMHDDGIYVTLKALETWFPLTADLDYNNLKISLKTLQPFPIEIKMARDETRNKLEKNKQPSQIEYEPENVPSPLFSLPYMNINSQTSIDNSDAAVKSVLVINTALLSGIFLGQDTKVSVNDTFGDNSAMQVRMSAGRRDPAGDLLGVGLSEYKFGDINTGVIPFVAKSNSGRGVSFSNKDPGASAGVQSNKVILRGELPVGYQVDIVKDGQLIGFVEEPDENGEYVFEAGVLSGLNVFEIVFYGPQGQKETKEERIFVPVNPIKKGDFRYGFGAMQDDVYLFSSPAPESNENAGKARFLADAEYGISENKSVYAALASVPVEGENRAYGLMRYGYSFKGVRSNLSFVKSQESGKGIGFGLQSIYKNLRWQAEHRLLYDFESEETLQSGLSGDLRHDTSIALSGLLPFMHSTPFSLNVDRLENTQGVSRTELRGRVTNNIKKLRVTTELNQVLQTNQSSNSEIGMQVSSRFQNVDLRGTLAYGFQPERYLKNVNLTADWRYMEATSIRGGLRYTGGDEAVKSALIGVSHDFDTIKLGVNVSYNDQHEFLALLSTSFSLGLDPVTKRPYMSKNDMTDSAVFVPKVFYDKNANTVFDEQDELLKDISFVGKGIDKKAKTDERGTAHISAHPYDRSHIAVDPGSLSDPYLRVRVKPKDYILRPNQTIVKEFPVVMTGEFDSQVYTYVNGSKTGAKAIGVQVLMPGGEVIESGKSEFDGFVAMDNIPLGQYEVRLDPEQLKSGGYCTQPAKSLVIDPENPAATIDEFNLWKTGQSGNKDILLAENIDVVGGESKWESVREELSGFFTEKKDVPDAYLVAMTEKQAAAEIYDLILYNVNADTANFICDSRGSSGEICRLSDSAASCPVKIAELEQGVAAVKAEEKPAPDIDLRPELIKELKQEDVEKLLAPKEEEKG